MKTFFKNHKKLLLIVGAAVLLVAAGVGATLAWMTSSPAGLVNTFDPGKVPVTVHEDPFDHTTKKNVTVSNDGNVSAWIRVALVPIWRNTDGSGTGLTASLSQCTVDWGTGWTYNSTDGYYYYNSIVPAGTSTASLINSLTVNSGLGDAYKGKQFELQVLAQSVQAEGMGTDSASAQAAFQHAYSSTTTTP